MKSNWRIFRITNENWECLLVLVEMYTMDTLMDKLNLCLHALMEVMMLFKLASTSGCPEIETIEQNTKYTHG